MSEADETMLWWESPEGQGYSYLTTYIDNIIQSNSWRLTNQVRFAALYGNWETTQLTSAFLARPIASNRQFKRLSFNICQSITDTVVNQRAAEMPDLMALSTDGDYRQFTLAKMLTAALRAELSSNNHDTMFPRVCQNACIFGNGYVTAEREDGALRIRRVFSPEIVVDPFDNVVDDWPHCFNHVRYVNKQTLIRQYPEKQREILNAASELSHIRSRNDENVRVMESWTCATAREPGKHLCSISTCDLVPIEDYPFPTPPFVSLPWGLPFQGWYSQGLIEQLMGLQMEITDTLEIIHEAIRLFSHPFMLVENSANVNLSHIQDVPGRIIKYTNTKPDVIAPNLLSQEVYAHLERCYQKAYEIAGINIYAAQAKTLPRYESSKAMRAASDQAEVRQFAFGKACEKYNTDLGLLICRESSILGEENNYKTRMPHSQYFRHIPWREIQYNVDTFKIQIDTVNRASNSVAANIQDLEDLAQLQQLSVPELRRYLLNPDIKRVLNIITASDEYIDYVIYQLCYEEKYVTPDQFMDIDSAFRNCVAEYLTGLRLGMSEAAKNNLLNFILALKTLQDERAQEAMNMQAQAQMSAQASQQSQMMQAPAQAQLPVTQPGSQQ